MKVPTKIVLIKTDPPPPPHTHTQKHTHVIKHRLTIWENADSTSFLCFSLFTRLLGKVNDFLDWEHNVEIMDPCMPPRLLLRVKARNY